MNTFSLDCERIWGMPNVISDEYISKNIAGSDDALHSIISSWNKENCELILAFVLASLPGHKSPPALERIKRLELKDKWVEEYEAFNCATAFGPEGRNITMGVHSVCHNLYTELDNTHLDLEIDTVIAFVEDNPSYKRMFVFPKNLSVSKAVKKYTKHFDKIRVNSRSWLYRSNSYGVSSTKRLLRYLDSFFPIYELFCDKSAEVDISNCVVGTHFFRANLPKWLLRIHLVRLKLGVRYLNWKDLPAHVWSHPHNFVDNNEAVRKFVQLGEILNHE